MVNRFYPSIAFRSSSGVVIGLMSKFFTSTSSTPGVMKAGSDGPQADVLDAEGEQGQQDGHRLLLVPRQHHRQGQLVHAQPKASESATAIWMAE